MRAGRTLGSCWSPEEARDMYIDVRESFLRQLGGRGPLPPVILVAEMTMA